MINTSKHIKDAIAFLNNQDVERLNEQFKYQKDYLNSQDYNYTLINIENNLNVLYEKARVLQDIIAYSREYVKQNVYAISDECKTILDSIEDSSDSLKSSNYISIGVPFEESTGPYTDRDNKSLPKYKVYDGTITLSGKEKNALAIKHIEQKNNFKPYSQNIDNLKESREYRAYYLLDAPVKNGLKEQINIEYEVEDTINQLNIVTSNCKAEAVKYIDVNGTVDSLLDHKNVIQSTRKVKSINFIITTDSYKKLTYYVDQSRLDSNFWDAISKHEYAFSATGKGTLTQSQIDKMAGLDAFKEAYALYQKKIEEWIAKRKAVVNQNISNGYSDAMPDIDFIVAPESLLSNDAINKQQTDVVAAPKETAIQQTVVLQKPDIYPDSEKIKHQTYNQQYSHLVDKNGKPVEHFIKLGDSTKYKRSYERK